MGDERSIDWRDVSLLGIDVGFSKHRKTTGMAFYRFGTNLRVECIGSRPEHRKSALRNNERYDAIAIDGPIVGDMTTIASRQCEHILSRGKFGERCKPGFSHFGTGLKLRHASSVIAAEMGDLKRNATTPVVEAFPNAFLGVMLNDEAYAAFGKIRRGRKSDIFFARAVNDGRFNALFDYLDWRDDELLDMVKKLATEPSRASHEYRAALVCVLTAACALSCKAQYIGDDLGGSICLPPKALWANWALRAGELGTRA